MLFREDLDAQVCSHPDCTETHEGPLYFRSRCHPQAGTWTIYQHGAGHLHVVCRVCEQPVAQVAVASRPNVLAIQRN
jgi:hypothetical protein